MMRAFNMRNAQGRAVTPDQGTHVTVSPAEYPLPIRGAPVRKLSHAGKEKCPWEAYPLIPGALAGPLISSRTTSEVAGLTAKASITAACKNSRRFHLARLCLEFPISVSIPRNHPPWQL